MNKTFAELRMFSQDKFSEIYLHRQTCSPDLCGIDNKETNSRTIAVTVIDLNLGLSDTCIKMSFFTGKLVKLELKYKTLKSEIIFRRSCILLRKSWVEIFIC